MKKSGSVTNVLVILIATFLGDILLHILQKKKIGVEISAKIARVTAAKTAYFYGGTKYNMSFTPKIFQ